MLIAGAPDTLGYFPPVQALTLQEAVGGAVTFKEEDGQMSHESEMGRIQAATRAANELINHLPPQIVDKLGRAQLVSDLSHQFLLSGIPSQELLERLRNQILAQALPKDDAI